MHQGDWDVQRRKRWVEEGAIEGFFWSRDVTGGTCLRAPAGRGTDRQSTYVAQPELEPVDEFAVSSLHGDPILHANLVERQGRLIAPRRAEPASPEQGLQHNQALVEDIRWREVQLHRLFVVRLGGRADRIPPYFLSAREDYIRPSARRPQKVAADQPMLPGFNTIDGPARVSKMDRLLNKVG